MKLRHEVNDPIAAMLRSRNAEIEKYRWIESERLGYDIGREQAEREWYRRHAREWRAWVRAQGLAHPVAELIWTQQEEIEKFKWIESERRGFDIGWEQAVREWCRQHYEAWQYNVLRDTKPPATKPARARQRSLPADHRAKLSSSMKLWWEKRRKQR